MLKTYVQIFIASVFIIFLIVLVTSNLEPNNSEHVEHVDVQQAKVDELVTLANDLKVTELASKICKDGLITTNELKILRITVKIALLEKYR